MIPICLGLGVIFSKEFANQANVIPQGFGWVLCKPPVPPPVPTFVTVDLIFQKLLTAIKCCLSSLRACCLSIIKDNELAAPPRLPGIPSKSTEF